MPDTENEELIARAREALDRMAANLMAVMSDRSGRDSVQRDHAAVGAALVSRPPVPVTAALPTIPQMYAGPRKSRWELDAAGQWWFRGYTDRPHPTPDQQDRTEFDVQTYGMPLVPVTPAPTPEWEYAISDGTYGPTVPTSTVSDIPVYASGFTSLRRRKTGPWEPVPAPETGEIDGRVPGLSNGRVGANRCRPGRTRDEGAVMSTTEPTEEMVEAAARSIAKESGHGNGLGLCWRQHIREARAALRAALSVAPPAPNEDREPQPPASEENTNA